MSSEFPFSIGQQWKTSCEKIEIKNPYTQKIIGTVHQAQEKDCEEAIQSAVCAFCDSCGDKLAWH